MKTSMTKILMASAGIMLSLLTLTAAAPAKTVSAKKTAPAKKTAATVYECTKCHMKVNAATAKKDHYKDPMDGGTFAAVKTAKK